MSGLSRPRPILIVRIRCASRSTKRSWADRSSRSRVGAVQVWAEFCISVVADEAAARSRSASAKMMFGDLPPSSSVTGTTLSAAAFMMAIPVGTEPVKVMWLMPGWAAIAAPVSRPPVTTLNTPGGHSRLPRQLREAHDAQAGLGCRFGDDGVSAGKRRGDAPRGEAQRIVPGHDLSRDAQRLT